MEPTRMRGGIGLLALAAGLVLFAMTFLTAGRAAPESATTPLLGLGLAAAGLLLAARWGRVKAPAR